MALGDNIPFKKERLIKTTTGKQKGRGAKAIPGQPSRNPGKDTYKTVKWTFYIRQDLFEGLRNYAHHEWVSITEAFNQVVADGLKGKKTKPKRGD